jgi:hypothetical protein
MLGTPATGIMAGEPVPVPPALSSSPEFVTAVEQIRRMRGGSQAHLMRCSDGHFYVVKFRNNPQSPRVLTNEYLAGKLARLLGLPCPNVCLIDVKEDLIRLTSDLSVELPLGRHPVAPGIAFGSEYPSWRCGKKRILFPVLDFDAAFGFGKIENLSDMLGILVFDKWTCNIDTRQVVCVEQPTVPSKTFRLFMIDNGFCFGNFVWKFNDLPRHGIYLYKNIYSKIHDDRLLDLWLQRLETKMTSEELNKIARELPESWIREDRVELADMLKRLYERKKTVAALAHQALNWLRSRQYGERGQAVAAD